MVTNTGALAGESAADGRAVVMNTCDCHLVVRLLNRLVGLLLFRSSNGRYYHRYNRHPKTGIVCIERLLVGGETPSSLPGATESPRLSDSERDSTALLTLIPRLL